ncbi:MAG TPA: M1 family aminopeptidase [Longimicrobiaceae bacterium]|nr:M1 family aminopeptidase [Longimicrobiaceae bacterium]
MAVGNSGDETIFSGAFSGIYEAKWVGGTWLLARRVPAEAQNRILAQHLHVAVIPGRGMRVVDTLDVVVGNPDGLTLRLNHRARLHEIRFDGQGVDHALGGGLLWIRAPSPGRARLALSYSLDVETDTLSEPNSGMFHPAFGHVRSQYYWHPRFEGESGADRADFVLTARIPAEYHLATSIPQTETVSGGVRTVRAQAARPTDALTLLYDREWHVAIRRFGHLGLQTFLTPDFRPAREELEAAFRRTYEILSQRFGEPRAGYFAVAQGRARGASGWHFRSNDLIVAGKNGGPPIQAEPIPRAYLGHEIAHGWTHPTGPAANFLREGWATYAESLLLAQEFGSEVEGAFWEAQRNRYEVGGHEGHRSILEDPTNSGVAYSKGAWIFRMLRHVMGEEAFTRGIRDYLQVAPGEPAGLKEFSAALSRAAGREMDTFLDPWVSEKVIPDIEARVKGTNLIVTQTGPVFTFPLEVELLARSGWVRRTVHLRQRSDTLDLGRLGPVSDIRVDPDHHLLMRRRRGQTVRYELPAPHAERVSLAGDFTSTPIPAVKEGDLWTVTIPLTDGRYYWRWVIEGGSAGEGQPTSGVRLVQPLKNLRSPYPR